MKKFILTTLFMLMLIGTVSAEDRMIPVSYAQYPILIDGVPLQIHERPLNYNGSTYIYLREAFEVMDCRLDYDPSDRMYEVFTPAYIQAQKASPSPTADSPKKCSVCGELADLNYFWTYQTKDRCIMLAFDFPKDDWIAPGDWYIDINETSKTIRLRNGSILTAGSDIIQIPRKNGSYQWYAKEKLPCPVEYIDGKIFLPIEACLNFDSQSSSVYRVYYDELQNEVFISKSEQ